MTVRSFTDGYLRGGRPHPFALYARIAVTVSILAYIGARLNWTELASDLGEARPWWLLAACALFGMTYCLAAIRWWFLLAVQDIHLPVILVGRLTLVGQFFNAFMLGSIGGDLVRILQVLKYVPNQRTHATLSVVMDRVVGLLLLLTGSALVLPSQWQALMATQASRDAVHALSALLGFIVVGGLVVLLMPFHRAPRPLKDFWTKLPSRHVIELAVSGVRSHVASLKYTAGALATGAVLTAVLVAAGCCIAAGLHLRIGFAQMLVVLTAAICATSLPISLGGHGVREAVFVAMFSAFGLGKTAPVDASGIREDAVLFSLLFFGMTLVWSVVGGAVYVTHRHADDENYGAVPGSGVFEPDLSVGNPTTHSSSAGHR
jgi:uncharacterized membrane protein YbhN (UPF0104 family)